MNTYLELGQDTGATAPYPTKRAIGLLITISNQVLGFMSHQQDYTTYSFNSHLLFFSITGGLILYLIDKVHSFNFYSLETCSCLT